jgi:putative membrane protein
LSLCKADLGNVRRARADPQVTGKLAWATLVPRIVSQLRKDAGHRVAVICLSAFTVIWALLAVAPRYREDWWLENLLTFICVPAAVLSYRRFQFSDRAYVQATLFAILHTIGSHYTYSEVPCGDWLREAFSLSRNHYDRLVHFAFGLLMLRPIRELTIRDPASMGPLAVSYLSFAAVACGSLFYEILEWLVAAIVDPMAGTAYLGTQGDVWDSQKDMLCASVGALLASLLEWRRLPHRPAARRNRSFGTKTSACGDRRHAPESTVHGGMP